MLCTYELYQVIKNTYHLIYGLCFFKKQNSCRIFVGQKFAIVMKISATIKLLVFKRLLPLLLLLKTFK